MALAAIMMGCTLLCFYMWLLRGLFPTRSKFHKRVQSVIDRPKPAVLPEEPVRTRKSRKIELGDQLEWLESLLQRGDIPISARDYAIRWLTMTICLAIVGYLFIGFIGLLLGIVARIIGSVVYIRLRAQRRLRRFDEALPEMLTVVSNSLKAGHSFAQALHIVCEDLHGPLQEEMMKVEQETQIGLGLEDALIRSAQRIGSQDFELIVTAIGIQRQVGGNLSEVLDKIRDTIRDRVRIHREVKMLTAQGRMSATIFMLMPAAIALLLYMINPSYMSVMVTTLPGFLMLGVALIGQVIGFFFIRKIIQVSL